MTPASGKRKIAPELVGFGAELKRLRESAGLTQMELARMVNVTRAYISHVENGKTKCRADFAQRCDTALHSSGELVQAWNDLLDSLKTSKYPKYFIDFPKAEANASQLRSYEAYVVYGLLQTPAYAMALLKNEQSVATRMRRQAHILSDPCPTISVVLEESILFRQVGTREVMREQLEFLIELSLRDRITIQIAPTAHYEDVRGSFTIATAPDRSEVAYGSLAFGGETTRDPEDLATVSQTMLALNIQALNAEDSRALIRKVIKERWS